MRQEGLFGSQLRAARGLLNMSVTELAEQTGLGLSTVKRAEATNGPVPITTANTRALVSTLEAAGVMFIPDGELGPGVRLKSVEPLPMQPRRRAGGSPDQA